MNKIHKKGLAADLMDYLFLVIAAFFCLMLIWGALKMGINAAEEKSLENIQEAVALGNEIAQSRAQLASGENVTLAELDKLGEEGKADG